MRHLPEEPEPAAADRSQIWLPLLRTLTSVFPRWIALKNIASTFGGEGDLDSLAPVEDWSGIEAVFREWAAEQGFSPVIVCRHRPSGPNFFAIDPNWPYVVQLDVMSARPFRSQPLLDANDARELAIDDTRGFRIVREGAQGLMNLCTNGTHRGGAPNWHGIREKRIVEMLESDPIGVREAARILRPPTWALNRVARAACEGSWDRGAMLAIEVAQLARGAREPGKMLRRLSYRDGGRLACPLKRLPRRRLPEDRDRWLREEMLPAHEEGHGLLDWPVTGVGQQ
jgi:hypothetical protein